MDPNNFELTLNLYVSTSQIKIRRGIIKQPMEKNQKSGVSRFFFLYLTNKRISLHNIPGLP